MTIISFLKRKILHLIIATFIILTIYFSYSAFENDSTNISNKIEKLHYVSHILSSIKINQIKINLISKDVSSGKNGQKEILIKIAESVKIIENNIRTLINISKQDQLNLDKEADLVRDSFLKYDQSIKKRSEYIVLSKTDSQFDERNNNFRSNILLISNKVNTEIEKNLNLLHISSIGTGNKTVFYAIFIVLFVPLTIMSLFWIVRSIK